MTKSTDERDVLEQNVSTLIESGGEPPRLPDLARARMRKALVAAHTSIAAPKKTPILAAGVGLLVAAATVALVVKVAHHGPPAAELAGGGGGSATTTANTLADGTSWTAGPGGTITVVAPRHVRVVGSVLLDVAVVLDAKGAHEPFTVDTAHGTISVLGTRFVVDALVDKTITAVVRGSVKLATSAGEVTLHAGEQGVAEAGRPPTRGPAPRLTSLVSWAAAARRKDETGVEPVRNGTLFARDPNAPWIPEAPLPIAKLSVDVVLEDQIARVAIDQTFTNTAPQVMEGMYRFAIPPDAALQRLAMYNHGKLTESAVVERMAARRIYEDAVYRQVDPALLEWAGTGRLALRVYPLNPHEDKRLVIAYTQSVPKLYDDYTLAVPLPEVDLPVGQLGFTVRVHDCAQCEVSSPSHAVTVKPDGADALVTYQATAAKLGDSLVLHVRDLRTQATITQHADASGQYLLVRARPELPTAQRSYRKHTWVILDDVSASRDPLALKAQADLVDGFLRELDEDDRVAVVPFDTSARVALELTRVDDVDRHAVRKALAAEGGVGATDFAAGLAKAESLLAGVDPRDASIVYLGDGVITAGARALDTLRTGLVGKAQFIGVGVGDGPDTQTLDALAAATGGYSTTLDLADDLNWRAFDLVAALHTTRAVGVTARLVDGEGRAVPATLYLGRTQLADGEELELVGKLAGTGLIAAVELDGTVDGQPWHQRVEIPTPVSTARPMIEAGYLPRLWAQRHIAARLLAKQEPVDVPVCTSASASACPDEAELREARDESIRKEVIALGKQFFLLSRHTSLLVLEDDAMYARYGVSKGAGSTWAPYALPATIPVTSTVTTAVAVPQDVELVRSPLALFYDYGAMMAQQRWTRSRDVLLDDSSALGVLGTARAGDGAGWDVERKDLSPSSAAAPRDEKAKADWSRDGATTTLMADSDPSEVRASVTSTTPATVSTTGAVGGPPPPPSASEAEDGDKRVTAITTSQLMGGSGRGGPATGGLWGGVAVPSPRSDIGNPQELQPASRFASGVVQPAHLMNPTDPAFADLTAFVPALVEDPTDRLRADLSAHGGAGKHELEAAARDRLAAARTALPTGVYRWGDLEIAVDRARHLGWHRTTSANLAETASFDGTTWTRRYPELGLDVTRVLAEDDIALALAYLPIWIAEPAHYARYFDVRASGPADVALWRTVKGTPQLVYTLAFDAGHHLTAIRDGVGRTVLAVTWSSAGPSAVMVGGEAVDVGFSGTPVGDAIAWAHGSSVPGVAVELPGHTATYWAAQLATLQVGSAEWRHAQRQFLAALAATSQPGGGLGAFAALAAHGGVELGDLVLASGGIGTAEVAQRKGLLGTIASTPVARYLAVDTQQLPAATEAIPAGGLVGALWNLRAATTFAAHGQYKQAVDRLVAIDTRALDFRLIGAATIGNTYATKRADLVRAWDAAAIGPYRNLGRASAALALGSRGDYDAAATRVAELAADYDLRALPAQLAQLQWIVTNSKRGQAGWLLAAGQIRDRVLADGDFAQVTALLLGQPAQGDQVQPLLDKAAQLAAGDPDRLVVVAQLGLALGQVAWVQGLVDPAVKATPSRALHQLAAQIALQQSRTQDALAHLEAAQRLADPGETVGLGQLRGELGTIFNLAGRVAREAPAGAARTAAVQHAMAWVTTWRKLDPQNGEIDRLAGDLMFAVGDPTEAWRQLSTMIEHDPMSGDGYQAVAAQFEQHGLVTDAIPMWHQAVIIDQTNPTPRLREAQAMFAVGRQAEGTAVLKEIANRRWHVRWGSIVYQARALLGEGGGSSGMRGE